MTSGGPDLKARGQKCPGPHTEECFGEVEQGRSIDLSALSDAELRHALIQAEIAFRASGGRGIELAEKLDCLRYETEQREKKRRAGKRSTRKRG